jgi:hypothetical protein
VSWRGGLTGAARTAPAPAAHDLPDRADLEAAVFDIAPVVDFAKYRAEPRIGNLQPATQRLDRTAALVSFTGDGEVADPVADAIEGHFGRSRGEPDMFDIQADQGSGAEAAGSHQQQLAIAQSGQVAAASDGQADQQGRRRAQRTAGAGVTAGVAQCCLYRSIDRWRGHTTLAVPGGDCACPPGRFCQGSRQNRPNEQYADKSGDRPVMICHAEPDARKEASKFVTLTLNLTESGIALATWTFRSL